MQGPLDLLPAVNVFSTIPGLKANYNLLKGKQTEFSPASLIGALLSKYISAGISIGNQKTSRSVANQMIQEFENFNLPCMGVVVNYVNG